VGTGVCGSSFGAVRNVRTLLVGERRCRAARAISAAPVLKPRAPFSEGGRYCIKMFRVPAKKPRPCPSSQFRHRAEAAPLLRCLPASSSLLPLLTLPQNTALKLPRRCRRKYHGGQPSAHCDFASTLLAICLSASGPACLVCARCIAVQASRDAWRGSFGPPSDSGFRVFRAAVLRTSAACFLPSIAVLCDEIRRIALPMGGFGR